MYEVRLKPGHPTGTYHRAGMTFTAEPVKLEKVPEAVAKDPWLIVSEAGEGAEAKVPEPTGSGPSNADFHAAVARIEELGKLASERASRITDLETAIIERDTLLQNGASAIAHLQDQNTQLQAEIQNKDQAIKDLEEKLAKKGKKD